jgi:hypothetical protein
MKRFLNATRGKSTVCWSKVVLGHRKWLLIFVVCEAPPQAQAADLCDVMCEGDDDEDMPLGYGAFDGAVCESMTFDLDDGRELSKKKQTSGKYIVAFFTITVYHTIQRGVSCVGYV